MGIGNRYREQGVGTSMMGNENREQVQGTGMVGTGTRNEDDGEQVQGTEIMGNRYREQKSMIGKHEVTGNGAIANYNQLTIGKYLPGSS